MSIILYHTHTKIPQHLLDCVQKIRQYSNIPIYLITDSDSHVDGTIHVSIKKYSDFDWLSDLNYFNGSDDISCMWKSSCFRLFHIQKLIYDRNLTNILHIDNDVLLYENPEKILEIMTEIYQGFAITAHNHDEVVMGMSYIKDHTSLVGLLDFVAGELRLNPSTLNNKYGGYPTEMRMISNWNNSDFIPILPPSVATDRYSKNFSKFNSVFDPSSYGQYISGTFSDKKPGWFGTHQEIGRHLSENSIQVIFIDRNPYLVYNGEKIKINNLHIHSKETSKYI